MAKYKNYDLNLTIKVSDAKKLDREARYRSQLYDPLEVIDPTTAIRILAEWAIECIPGLEVEDSGCEPFQEED